MNVDALAQAHGITAAVQFASLRTGVDFNYLYAQAKTESGLDPNAQARTSSARGLYQFTSGTWLETVRKHGAEYGLTGAATALADGSAAHDPAIKAAILDLRHDPAASALMAGAYAADNAIKLEAGLGRVATSTDVYIAHFLGAAGALRFLKARAADPVAKAAAVVPAAARSNHGVFFAVNGEARSLASVYDRLAAKLGGNPVSSTGTAFPVAAPSMMAVAAVTASDVARLAYLQLAELSA